MTPNRLQCCATIGILGLVAAAGAAELNSPTPNAKAADLVAAALRTELDGPSPQRQELLQQAIARDPNFAPARWQLGFVRWDDQWRTLDEVAKLAGDDPQMAEYRQRRDALVDTSDNQREMAHWCKKHKLTDEARMHWSKVLSYEPDDAEALQALGVQWVDGKLLTRPQLEEAKKLRAARMQAQYRWRPKLVNLRSKILDGDPQQKAAATAELEQLSDPAAIDALELVFASDKDDPRATRLNLLLVSALARMPQAEATAALLRRAAYCKSSDVALAAADALKARPMHSYVPQLIATMPSPLKSSFHVSVAANGAVLHEHQLKMERSEGTYVMSYESVVVPTNTALASQVVTPRAVAREQAKAGAIEAAVAAEQQTRDVLAKRIQLVLKRTTGFEDVEDPRLWIQQYTEYYGWSMPEKSHKEFRQTAWDYEVYFPLPPVWSPERPPVDPATAGILSGPGTGRALPINAAGAGECFAAGTPVITVLGPRPIETIKPGDRVLSQNVDTGELAYKTVQERTLRKSVKLIKLTAGEESLVATPGHVFFVAGSGWNVAKYLKVGDRLCGLGSGALVETLEEQPRSEVYNLVVSDFHTFFVGNGKLLVHDDAALEDTMARVPGLLADAQP